MNKINLNWKYGLVLLMLAAVYACSENEELSHMTQQEHLENTRTANWYTKEVVLDSIGTLEARVTEAMDGDSLTKLEKLVVSGPMAAADFNYLKQNLTGLNVLDMRNANIRASDVRYSTNWSNQWLKNDTICEHMFYNFDQLIEVVLPSSVLYVEDYAFALCDSLLSVVIPDGVKIIDNYAFQSCKNLSTVTLPSTLEGINGDVFVGCNSLETITIPDKVKYLGSYVFYECNELASVVFSSDSELDSIASYAFVNLNLKSITIPNSVRYIGNYAFDGCSSMTSVVLPSNLEGIESYAFADCDSLQSIVIPDKVKYIGNDAFRGNDLLSFIEFSSASELDSIGNHAFYNSNLKSIVIPDSVHYIGDNAFDRCDSLATVTLPAKLTYLGRYAFRECSSLESIDIPNGVRQLNDGTFYVCTSLKTVKLPVNLESIGSYGITGSLVETLELPSTIKRISSYAFEHNEYITKVVVPEGVETIGTQAFRGNIGLKELTIPSTVTNIESDFAHNCNRLQALFWNAPIDVPYNYNTWNCFLYVETDQEITVDGSWNNVILNGVAQSTITIQENTDSEFRILKEFTAPEVVYTRYFGDTTTPGGSSGWQTIVLPFTPDSISHESKGLIAPFGSDVTGVKPFWLRELTSDGFKDVTTITADKAYIIAMPNHSDYLNEYCLNGTITFKGKNVTLAVTPDELEGSVGPDFEFHPTYSKVKKTLRVYALQSQWGTYNDMWYNKNFFIRSSSDIYPFNAYVTALGGGRSSRTEFDLDTRSSATRGVPYKPNTTGVPQIGDM